MRSIALTLFVLLFAPLWNHASSMAAAAPASNRGASSASTSTALSDSQIEQDLRARLSRSKLATKKFQFRVQGGVATLTGRTDVVQHKGIMTRMAKASGARAVVNNIEISEAARAKAAAKLEAGRRKAVVSHQPASANSGAGGGGGR
jgi:hypothetical protein